MSRDKAERRRERIAQALERCAPIEALEGEVDSLSKGAVVALCSPGFSGRDRRRLRAAGHSLEAVIHIGHQGLHAALAEAIDAALLRHELVKVKCLESAPQDASTAALWIHRVTGAQVVQLLGRTLLAYRPHPEQPVIVL